MKANNSTTSASDIAFAGKLVSQGNLFLVTLAEIFIIILVVKQITYNAKVSDITIFKETDGSNWQKNTN